VKYLIDTCVVSDFLKGDSNTLNKLKSISPKNIVISSITIMKIEYGLSLNRPLDIMISFLQAPQWKQTDFCDFKYQRI
jgi:predicted nucleic acid-binding protein